MLFDASGMERAFKRMEEGAQRGGKTLAVKEGNFFVRMARKISRENAPDPMEILDVGLKLQGRLRRKPGVTIMAEIGRRISKIGLLSRGWRLWKVESERFRIRVWIIDRVSYSKVVDDKQGLSKQAAAIVGKTFQKGLEKLAKKVTGDFNRGH